MSFLRCRFNPLKRCGLNFGADFVCEFRCGLNFGADFVRGFSSVHAGLHFGQREMVDCCSNGEVGILERFSVAPALQREMHSVSESWETSIGPCRGPWLWFYPTLLRCSFIHSLVRLGLYMYFVALSYRMGHAQFACNVHGRPFCCDLVIARRVDTW